MKLTNTEKKKQLPLETIKINGFPIHNSNYFKNENYVGTEMVGDVRIELENNFFEKIVNGISGYGFGSAEEQGYHHIAKEAQKKGADFAILTELGHEEKLTEGLFGLVKREITKISADLYKNPSK